MQEVLSNNAACMYAAYPLMSRVKPAAKSQDNEIKVDSNNGQKRVGLQRNEIHTSATTSSQIGASIPAQLYQAHCHALLLHPQQA